MKRSVENLIIINLLNYINNFAFLHVNALTDLTVFSAMWVVSPLFFLTISSFILATDYKEDYQIFKAEAMIDYGLRVVAYAVAFINDDYGVFSFEYILRFAVLILLFAISLYLEFKMYQKAKKYVPNKLSNKVVEVSEEEQQNIQNMNRAVTLGVLSIFVACFGPLNFFTFTNINIIFGIIPIFLFIVFLHLNLRKVNLFYLNKALGKRIFIRDAIYACLGFIFILFIAFKVFSFGKIDLTIGMIFGVFTLYPTIRTNRKMALRCKEIIKTNDR